MLSEWGAPVALRDKQLWTEIANQRAWIKKCGGDLAGYRSHYTSIHVDPNHGEMGENADAMYAADTAELERLLALAKARGLDPDSPPTLKWKKRPSAWWLGLAAVAATVIGHAALKSYVRHKEAERKEIIDQAMRKSMLRKADEERRVPWGVQKLPPATSDDLKALMEKSGR
jgi:hypothetical protein